MARELTHAQLQEYWDACLIKQWRSFGSVLDAICQWERLTERKFMDVEMLRKPRGGMPWKIGVRVFVAEFLPKINDRLIDQPREKDVALLKKLQTSNYTTLSMAMPSQKERDRRSVENQIRKANAIYKLDSEVHGNRNHDTDWGVTKGSRRHTR